MEGIIRTEGKESCDILQPFGPAIAPPPAWVHSSLHQDSFHHNAKKSPNSTRNPFMAARRRVRTPPGEKPPSALTLLVRVMSLVGVLQTLTRVLVGHFTVTDLEHLLHGCDGHVCGLNLTGEYHEGWISCHRCQCRGSKPSVATGDALASAINRQTRWMLRIAVASVRFLSQNPAEASKGNSAFLEKAPYEQQPPVGSENLRRAVQPWWRRDGINR